MKYNSAALAQAAQKALAAHRAEWDLAQERAAAKVLADRSEWVETWGPRWAEAVKVIQRRLRRGEPLVHGDLPTSNRTGGVAVYYGPHRADQPKPASDYRPPEDLVVLVKLLETVADDTITTTGLRDMGITSGAMRRCLVHMAASTATN